MKNILGLTTVLAVCVLCGCGKKETDDEKLSLAATAFRAGESDKSVELVGEVRRHDPENLSAMILAALQYEQKGEADKALDLARQAMTAAPEDFSAQYTFGRLSAKDPYRRNEAFAALQRALVLRPNDTDTLVMLCNIGTASGNAKTEEYLNQLLRHKGYSKSPTLYYQYGLAKARSGQTAQALIFFRQAVKNGGGGNPLLILNVARAVDRFHLSVKDAKYYYKFFLSHPNTKNPELRAEAQNRLAVLR